MWFMPRRRRPMVTLTANSKPKICRPVRMSPYGVAKLGSEYYCQTFTTVYGLETVCLRYFNVFGPQQDPTSQYAAVIPLFITQMLDGQSPTIHGDGLQSRDFTYIDNVVHGNLLAATAPKASGQVMNLATGGRVTLLDLVEKINGALNTSIQPHHVEVAYRRHQTFACQHRQSAGAAGV